MRKCYLLVLMLGLWLPVQAWAQIQTGGMLSIVGTVTKGSLTEPVGLFVHDSEIHSGVFRISPCDVPAISSDSFVLQGGSPTGCDNGDAFETTQNDGIFHFIQAGTATVAGYQFDVTTHYQFGGSNSSGTITASPDTGFIIIVNGGASTFVGTISVSGNSPFCGAAFDAFTFTAASPFAPTASRTFALTNESSNCGGFDGPTTGAFFSMVGDVNNLLGEISESVNLVVSDGAIHSGTPGTGPCDGLTTDAFVLQGGSRSGCDNGDAFETSQSPGDFVFSEVASGYSKPGYSFDVATNYQMKPNDGSLCNTSGNTGPIEPICATPDTGLLTVKNNSEISTFYGTMILAGTSAIPGGVSCPKGGYAFDSFTGYLHPGDSRTFALSPDSSNCGGFNTSPPQPVAPGTTTTFTNGNVINQIIAIPPNANMNGTAFMEVIFQQISPPLFDSTRLPPTGTNTWSDGRPVKPGAACHGIPNAGGNCIIMEIRCFDANGAPIFPCNIVGSKASPNELFSKYGMGLIQPNPALIIATDNLNDWADVTDFYDPSDPRLRGGPTIINTDTVVTDLPPIITFTTPPAPPLPAGSYHLHTTVKASYACSDPQPVTPPSCTGTVPNNSNIDTSSAGTKHFTVSSTDIVGLTSSQTVSYNVICDYLTVTFNPSTVARGHLTTINGNLVSCSNAAQVVVTKFTLTGPLQPNSCGSSDVVKFSTPPYTIPPNTSLNVSFPFFVPKKVCPGNYLLTTATSVGGVVVNTTTAALKVTP